MAVLMLVCALAATAAEAKEGPYRVHQHLTARQPDAGCDCGGTELCTHLPLVIIDTGGEEIPGEPVELGDGTTVFTTTENGEEMLGARISILDDESHNHHPSDAPDLETDSLIRIREIPPATLIRRAISSDLPSRMGIMLIIRSWAWTPTMNGPSTAPIWTRA